MRPVFRAVRQRLSVTERLPFPQRKDYSRIMTNDHSKLPSADEAKQALQSVNESRQALAGHIRSPAWLYPIQGLAMGLFILGLVFSKDNGWGSSLLAVTIVIFCLLPLLQSRSNVVVDVYTHRGSRRLAMIYVATFALLTTATLVLYSLYSWAWLAYGAAVLALVLTLVMGPAIENRLERALRNDPR